MDAAHAGNTYLEIMRFMDRRPVTVGVIDRTTLGESYASIMDLSVYRGEVFLLDGGSGLYRLKVGTGNTFQMLSYYAGVGFSRFSLYSDDLDTSLLVVLTNNHAIYEVNWD